MVEKIITGLTVTWLSICMALLGLCFPALAPLLVLGAIYYLSRP